MNKAYYVIVNEGTGARLCRDNKWREFHAPFGSYPGCVKIYRKLGWAERKMDRLNQGRTVAFVQTVGPGQAMDASGKILNASDI